MKLKEEKVICGLVSQGNFRKRTPNKKKIQQQYLHMLFSSLKVIVLFLLSLVL